MAPGTAGSKRPQLLARTVGIDRQRRQMALEAARRRYMGLSAIGKRLLNRPEPMASAEPVGSPPEPDKPHHRRRYGPEVVAALVPLWEASDPLCGKRLQA